MGRYRYLVSHPGAEIGSQPKSLFRTPGMNRALPVKMGIQKDPGRVAKDCLTGSASISMTLLTDLVGVGGAVIVNPHFPDLRGGRFVVVPIPT